MENSVDLDNLDENHGEELGIESEDVLDDQNFSPVK